MLTNFVLDHDGKPTMKGNELGLRALHSMDHAVADACHGSESSLRFKPIHKKRYGRCVVRTSDLTVAALVFDRLLKIQPRPARFNAIDFSRESPFQHSARLIECELTPLASRNGVIDNCPGSL